MVDLLIQKIWQLTYVEMGTCIGVETPLTTYKQLDQILATLLETAKPSENLSIAKTLSN